MFVPTNADRTEGKWVRYDSEGGMVKGENYANGEWYRFDAITGVMIKGWYQDSDGNLYYYDEINGQMVHGARDIAEEPCAFDDNTGIALNCQWYTIGGDEFWYEGGKRQGLQGRGKEIFDPASNAWYWLDAIDGGRKAKAKDVYQESSGGKWVRYDSDGGMVKGWNEQNGNIYYFDLITGAMQKGEYCDADGNWYLFDEGTGVMAIGDVYRNDNWYYYDEETGAMVKGEIKRDGYWYTYDSVTGVLLKKEEGDINYKNEGNLVVTFEDEFEVHASYSLYGKLHSKAMITEWESDTTYKWDGTYNIQLHCTVLVGYLGDYSTASIKYELFDEKGVCIENSYIMVSNVESGKRYKDTIYFWGLPAGKYTLKFSDFHY